MSQTLTEENWGVVESDLFAGARLQALIKIRQFSGLDLKESAELMYARYEKLRAEQPGKFVRDHEEYWKDWYS